MPFTCPTLPAAPLPATTCLPHTVACLLVLDYYLPSHSLLLCCCSPPATTSSLFLHLHIFILPFSVFWDYHCSSLFLHHSLLLRSALFLLSYYLPVNLLPPALGSYGFWDQHIWFCCLVPILFLFARILCHPHLHTCLPACT